MFHRYIDLRPKAENENVETINKAFAPMAITLTLNDQIDISRGDVIIKNTLPNISNQVSANVVWMDETLCN